MSKLVTIRTFGDYFSAHVTQQSLDAYGIPSSLLNDNMGTVFMPLAVGGIKLQVREEDKERALTLLDQLENKAKEEQDTPAYWEEQTEGLDPDNRVCVHCGSKNTTIVDASRKTFLGQQVFRIAPALFDKEKWHCFHCGKDF